MSIWDGDIDLVVSDRRNYELIIMLNCGNGSFPSVLRLGDPMSGYNRIITLNDLDGDGDLDIGRRPAPTARVYLNNGRTPYGDWLGFDDGQSYHAGFEPHWIEAADINGDGQLDLLVANYGASSIHTGWDVLLNDGSGGFTSVSESLEPLFARCLSLTSADLDLDGDLDVVVSTQSGHLHLFENLGTTSAGLWRGTSLRSTIELGSSIGSVRSSDLNADGHLDLVACHRSQSYFSIIENSGDWALELLHVPSPHYGELVEPADLNGDGIPDLSLISRSTGSLHVFLRNPEEGDYVESHSTPTDLDAEAKFMTHADLDGDGDMDYAIVNAHPDIDGGSVKTGFNQTVSSSDGDPFEPCVSTTWLVDDDEPADFDSIQAAVENASDGDEVVVMPGTYTSSGPAVLDTLGKAILIRASTTSPPAVIDGESSRRGIICASGETNLTIIDGFMFRNCIDPDAGGAILCDDSHPLIRNCSFAGSCAAMVGSAIACTDAAGVRIIGCTLDTSATSSFAAHGSVVRLEHCLFNGGGVFLTNSEATVHACTLSHHAATAFSLIEASAQFDDCIISENASVAIDADPGNGHTIVIGTTHFCQNEGGDILGEWTDAGGNIFQDTCSYLCPGDTNNDQVADVADMLLVLSHWGTSHPATDLNFDATTDVIDLLIILSSWGPCD